MNCKYCSARGKAWLDEENYGPCPECHGFGIIQCCEGSSSSSPVIEPSIVRGKTKRETYDPSKERVIATGYEKIWIEAPTPLVKEIIDILVKSFKLQSN